MKDGVDPRQKKFIKLWLSMPIVLNKKSINNPLSK